MLPLDVSVIAALCSLWTCLFYSRLCCPWTCLFYSSLCCFCTCLFYSSLCCLWTCLLYSSLCCLWTCLFYSSLCFLRTYLRWLEMFAKMLSADRRKRRFSFELHSWWTGRRAPSHAAPCIPHWTEKKYQIVSCIATRCMFYCVLVASRGIFLKERRLLREK
jgi:hypothetical protein